MDRGGWWAGLGMMDGWQVAVVVGEETVDHQKGGWRNKEKKLNKGDLLRPMMVIWISKERGDQGLSNDLTIKGIGQEMSEIWRVQEVKNSGNWGGLPEVDMRDPGQGRTVEALREVLGWGGSRRDQRKAGKGQKEKIVKNKKLGNVDDKTLVEQPQMGACGRLLRQQDAFLILYRVIAKLCNLNKNWWRYKQKMVKKCENWGREGGKRYESKA